VLDIIDAGPGRPDWPASAAGFKLFPFSPEPAWYERHWYGPVDRLQCPRWLRSGIGRLHATVHLAPARQRPTAAPVWLGRGRAELRR
jgi:hypothetical protein